MYACATGGSFFAGGRVQSTSANVARVRLVWDDGYVLEDELQNGAALFFGARDSFHPATAEFLDSAGRLIGAHTTPIDEQERSPASNARSPGVRPSSSGAGSTRRPRSLASAERSLPCCIRSQWAAPWATGLSSAGCRSTSPIRSMLSLASRKRPDRRGATGGSGLARRSNRCCRRTRPLLEALRETLLPVTSMRHSSEAERAERAGDRAHAQGLGMVRQRRHSSLGHRGVLDGLATLWRGRCRFDRGAEAAARGRIAAQGVASRGGRSDRR
jgi:hypothetical protein